MQSKPFFSDFWELFWCQFHNLNNTITVSYKFEAAIMQDPDPVLFQETLSQSIPCFQRLYDRFS